VHYSPHRPVESIDLVLIVNGLPVATLELKTQFTQSVYDAIRQYKYDHPVEDPPTISIGGSSVGNVETAINRDTRCRERDTSPESARCRQNSPP
jgi:type I restriction enzyme, R subunit